MQYTNDLSDFKIPYRHYTKTDLEVMQQRYMQLNNKSTGLNFRYLIYGKTSQE